MGYQNVSNNDDIFIITGSDQKKVGGTILGACGNGAGLDNIQLTNRYSVGNDGRADFTAGMTTISKTSPLAISGIESYSGFLAIDTGVAVSEGVTISVSGEYPVTGTYTVIQVVGSLAVTDALWYTCMSGTDLSVYWLSNGTADPVNPVSNYQFADCSIPSPSNQGEGVHSSTGAYIARTYANCWECFNGTLDPCDITLENVQLGLDQSLTIANMHFSEPCGPKEKNASGYPQTPGSDNP